jgi:hypothetical protein
MDLSYETEMGITRLHSVQNSLWNMLWTCRTKLKWESLDCTLCRTHFGTCYGPVARLHDNDAAFSALTVFLYQVGEPVN